jgi:type IV pilus assembly protein PilW
MNGIPNKERGISLIEMMVGLTVGLVFLLIMTQILGVQSAQKESTASGSTAQTAGAIALYTIERDARMAGFGGNGAPLLGCRVNGYYQGTATIDPLLFTFAPVQIATGVNSDTLTIAYGTSEGNLSPAKLTAAHSGDNADYQVDNRFGFHEGDLMIVAQDGVDPNADGINDCTLVQVTGLPSAAGETSNISGKTGTYTDARTGIASQTKYNKTGGLSIAYTSGARVYNMGAPASRIYTVNGGTGQLTMQDIVTGMPARPLADGIVSLRARYGKDTDGDGSIDAYDTTTPATAADWSKVIAVHVAVVARGAKREVDLVTGASLKLWPDVTLPSGAVVSGLTMALTAEQQHYRYRVFQTLVPLRNRIWTIPANS